MEKETLVTSESLNPEADDACFSACYYVGYTFEHTHKPAVEQQVE